MCDVRRLMQVQNQLQPLYFIYNKVEKTIFEFREMSQNATLVVRGGGGGSVILQGYIASCRGVIYNETL